LRKETVENHILKNASNFKVEQRASSTLARHQTLKTSEKFPRLFKELNDSAAEVPAYQRFQRQDDDNCYLRADLRGVK
jgi:hypothetical protein